MPSLRHEVVVDLFRQILDMFEFGQELGEARGEVKGKAMGEAKSILKLLHKRGVTVDEGSQARVLACRDQVLLDRWFDRAITATAVQELFTG